jgi:uncharacterized protein (DUF433 family)
MKIKEGIVVDPKAIAGKPVMNGTRIPVDAIIKRMADGMSMREILEEYPNLTEKRHKCCVEICGKNSS